MLRRNRVPEDTRRALERQAYRHKQWDMNPTHQAIEYHTLRKERTSSFLDEVLLCINDKLKSSTQSDKVSSRSVDQLTEMMQKLGNYEEGLVRKIQSLVQQTPYNNCVLRMYYALRNLESLNQKNIKDLWVSYSQSELF